MRSNITRKDINTLIKYLKQEDPRLTNGPKVKEFEGAWGNWLGTPYNVMVNSGASANMITFSILREAYPKGGEVILSPLNWVSDVTSVIRNGFTPIFVDIDLTTLGLDLHKVIAAQTNDTIAILLTHILGYNALEPWFLDKIDTYLVEDVCESHGATMNGKKVGTFGSVSNFSFYFAHHMSTIEGGMISSREPIIIDAARMLRSHGMLRESTSDSLKAAYEKDFPELHPEFIFPVTGYNMRSTELNAILGLSQLQYLDKNIKLRNKNLKLFLDNLNSDKFYTDYKLEGCSNYAFTLLLREPNDELLAKTIKLLQDEGIEYRRGMSGGGNQLRQPYLSEYKFKYWEYKNVEHVHKYGFYIGNYPGLEAEKIVDLAIKLSAI
jgi:CDP-6-deoxy-D-xylo-4-hexulose-3-dehydrase